jgi:hypothetical protein
MQIYGSDVNGRNGIIRPMLQAASGLSNIIRESPVKQ